MVLKFGNDHKKIIFANCIVIGQPYGFVAQLAECLQGKRENLGLSSCWATIFVLSLSHLVASLANVI